MGDETYYRGARWFVPIPSWESTVTEKHISNISRETLPEDIIYKCIFIYCYLYSSDFQNTATRLNHYFDWMGANPRVVKTWLQKQLYDIDKSVLDTVLKILNGKTFFYSTMMYRTKQFVGTGFLNEFIESNNIPLDTLVQIADI